jgi:hypothetical protein
MDKNSVLGTLRISPYTLQYITAGSIASVLCDTRGTERGCRQRTYVSSKLIEHIYWTNIHLICISWHRIPESLQWHTRLRDVRVAKIASRTWYCNIFCTRAGTITLLELRNAVVAFGAFNDGKKDCTPESPQVCCISRAPNQRPTFITLDLKVVYKWQDRRVVK